MPFDVDDIEKNKHNTAFAQDTAWKDIIEIYFQDCLTLCLPDLSALIDWNIPWVSLDKELQAVTKDSLTGRRLVDKLLKVFLKTGQEQWILIHLDVQGTEEDNFPLRMLTYNYRLFDKYQRPIVSCAILTDGDKDWRPDRYEVGLAGSYLSIKYRVVKLLDYKSQAAELEESTNLFANVILSQLAALEIKRKSPEQRLAVKFALTRRLYEKGYGTEVIRSLYRFIDYLIGLPELLEIEYKEEVYQLEVKTNMPYISTIERMGIEQGILQGIERGIEQERRTLASRLLGDNMPVEKVVKLTELSLEAVKKLKEKQSTEVV